METPKQVLCGLASAIAAGVGSVAITLGLSVLWPDIVTENFALIIAGSFLVLWWIFFLAFAGSKKGH